MCTTGECEGQFVNRRTFLTSVALTAVGASIDLGFTQSQLRAVDDPKIIHDKVLVKNGESSIDGYLSRPNKKGKYPAIVVIPGTWIIEPYIAETTAQLAQLGFVAMAIDVFHFLPQPATWEEARRMKMPPDVMQTKFTELNMVNDIQRGINYLKEQAFVKLGRFGITGFCGGGWNALLFSAHSTDIGAVAPFYAPVIAQEANRRSSMDVVNDISVPVLYHYAVKDEYIKLEDVKKFEAALQGRGTKVEVHTYDALHGFFAYDRAGIYQSEAAKLALGRTHQFFRKYL